MCVRGGRFARGIKRARIKMGRGCAQLRVCARFGGRMSAGLVARVRARARSSVCVCTRMNLRVREGVVRVVMLVYVLAGMRRENCVLMRAYYVSRGDAPTIYGGGWQECVEVWRAGEEGIEVYVQCICTIQVRASLISDMCINAHYK